MNVSEHFFTHHAIWSYHESSYCFEEPNPYLNQAIQKMLAKFSYPKISQDWNFKLPNHPRHMRIRSTRPGALSMSDIICMGFCWIQSLYDYLIKQDQFKTWYNELIYMNRMKMNSSHNGIRLGPFLLMSGSQSSQTQVQCKKAKLGCMTW